MINIAAAARLALIGRTMLPLSPHPSPIGLDRPPRACGCPGWIYRNTVMTARMERGFRRPELDQGYHQSAKRQGKTAIFTMMIRCVSPFIAMDYKFIAEVMQRRRLARV